MAKKVNPQPPPVLRSQAQWKSLGMVPRTGELPRVIKESRGIYAKSPLYDETQMRPVRAVAKLKPAGLEITVANVLEATWTVARSANRYSDAAQKYDARRRFGLACISRQKMGLLSGCKDRGIAWLAAQGAIAAVGTDGRLCIWQGAGYYFRSCLAPVGMAGPYADLPIGFDDAKPNAKVEMRLIDAEELLTRVPASPTSRAQLVWLYPPAVSQPYATSAAGGIR